MADEKTKVFSNVGRQGQGQGYQTIQEVIKDLGGGAGTVERLYFQDPETGRVFDYDYDDSEFEGLDPGYYGKSLGDLQLVSGISKQKGSDKNVRFTVDDPNKYDVSGVLGYDPETAETIRQEILKDDPSDNDLFYTAPNGDTYVDVTGTGQGIPVGSTNIRRIGAVDTPALEKTYDGYQAMGTSTQQELLDTVPKSGTFFEAFTPQSMGGKPFDLGAALGMDAGKLVFSNPPSNQRNLEQFYQNVQDVGGIENFLRSSQDKLGLLKQYGFKNLMTGNLPSEFLTMDGRLDEANINNTLNEYLSGTTASGDPSTTFGNTFDQISGGGDFINNSGDNQGTTTPSTTTPDTPQVSSPQGQAFVPMSSGFFPSPEIPTGPRTFAPDPRLDPIFPQYATTNVPPPSVGIPPGIPPFVRRPFLPNVETDYDPAQLYRDSGLPAPGEPGYNPLITPGGRTPQGIASLPNPMLEEDSPSMTQGIMS